MQQIIIRQVAAFAGGLALAGIFLLSNNLFTVIGIHSLSNYSLSLFEGSNNSDLMRAFINLVPLLVLVILAIRRRMASR